MKKFRNLISGLAYLLLLLPNSSNAQSVFGIAQQVKDYQSYGEFSKYLEELDHYKETSDSGKFRKCAEDLRILARKDGMDQVYYYSYHEECAFLINHNYLSEARHLLDKVYGDAFANDSPYGLYICYLCTGHLYDVRDERNLAMKYYEKAAGILHDYDIGQSPATAYAFAAYEAILDMLFEKAYVYAVLGLSERNTPEIRTSLLDIKAFSAFATGRTAEFELLFSEYSKAAELSAGHFATAFSPVVWNIIHGEPYERQYNVSTLLAMKMAFAHSGRYEESLEYSDSLLDYVICNRDRNSEYDLYQRAARLDNERLEYEKQELVYKNRLAQRRMIVWIMSVVFILAILFMFTIIVRNRKHIRQLKEANEVKDHFVQNMSHEVRTPLNSIIGFSQLLTMPDDMVSAEERKEYTEYVINNSNMLLMLVDDILNSADIESGKYVIRPELCKLETICRASMRAIESRIPAGVETEITCDAPDGYEICTDALRVQQLLVNLLVNSCKNTLHGRIKLGSSIKEKPGFVVFRVTDTGCGVPAEKAEAIFERFVKLDEYKQGSGMGLSICRDLAGRLGGKVYLDTSYTGGACFVFELAK